ncbi:MAG: hypothetical protein OXO56_07965 [Gammaproteobacteria bacterium]|nr:hypothetical protein [Gammaproteobacteria bacterium]
MPKPKKLRPDFAQNAHRVVMEATGQWPKTKPPGERSDAEKHPEAVRLGREGGKAKARRESND